MIKFLKRTLGNNRGEGGESDVDDIFADLDKLALESEPKPPEEPKEPETKVGDSLKLLTDELAELKKERQGLLSATKAERHKRQDLERNFNNLTNTVNNILQQRQAAKNDDPNNIGVPVVMNEEGDQGLIPGDKINAILNPLVNKVTQLENLIKVSNTAADGQRQANETIESIVGTDDRFRPVYNKYKVARKWVNDQVIDYQKDNNLNGIMNSGQALDHVFDKDLETEFNKQFPEFSLTDVVTSGDSRRHFAAMLSNTADTLDELVGGKSKTSTDKNTLKKIMNKPAGLGGATNAKANELSIVEKVGNLDASAIFDMTDAQAAQLEKAMLDEEKADGVTF